MRSILRSLIPLVLVLAGSACSSKKDANERHVVVLFTTDEHSQLFASFPEMDDFIQAGRGYTLPAIGLQGGLARRMTILKQQRDAAAARGAASLTLSSGDFSQGSLSSAAWLVTSPELAMMKTMGYDASALGNHEFDLRTPALAQAIGAAVSLSDGTTPQRPPLVLTNLLQPGALAPLYGAGKPVAPYLVLSTTNGLKIGIVASMGVGAGTVSGMPDGTFWAPNLATNDAKFASVAAQVQAGIDALRAQGVDAVILLGHGGIGTDAMHPGEDELLALQLKGVDLILSGHSHLNTPQPRFVYGSGTAVPVVQPKPFGREVGKVELVFKDDGSAPRPYLDPNGTQFIAVDDSVAPTTDSAFLPPFGELFQRTVGYLGIGRRAQPGIPPGTVTAPSFIEKELTTITGTDFTGLASVNPADATYVGNLWNFPLCKLDFKVTGIASGQETNVMNLDTDAMLAAVKGAASVGIPGIGAGATACTACPATQLAVQASGPIRGDLVPSSYDPGKRLGFADVYHVTPLGADPTALPPADLTDLNAVQNYLNAVPGYPLVKFNVPTVSLRIVYEATLQYAMLNGDFFLGASGLEVHYDLTRSPFDTAAVNPSNLATLVAPGWVTYMKLASESTPFYDVTPTTAYGATYGFRPDTLSQASPTYFRSVATTLYVASFAASFGITLYDDAMPPNAITNPAGAIVHRADSSNIKDYEALGQYLAATCALTATGPTASLPSTYDATTPEGHVPRRIVNCSGGTCP
ncbi:MAG TPA: metallophosphoesterase [Anaeromyxobacter sp.]